MKHISFRHKKVFLGNDNLEVILVGERVNKHYKTMFDSSKNYSLKLDENTYNVNKDELYRAEKSFTEKFLCAIHASKLKEKYVAFFDEKEKQTEAIKPKTISFAEPTVSAHLLYISLYARVFKRGIDSLLKGEGFGIKGRTLLFIVIIIAVASIVGFLGYQQGWFNQLLHMGK
jgi:hypothetical protein